MAIANETLTSLDRACLIHNGLLQTASNIDLAPLKGPSEGLPSLKRVRRVLVSDKKCIASFRFVVFCLPFVVPSGI